MHLNRSCRACGTHLIPISLCTVCKEYVSWSCMNCLKLDDVTHSHSYCRVSYKVEVPKIKHWGIRPLDNTAYDLGSLSMLPVSYWLYHLKYIQYSLEYHLAAKLGISRFKETPFQRTKKIVQNIQPWPFSHIHSSAWKKSWDHSWYFGDYRSKSLYDNATSSPSYRNKNWWLG